MCTSVAVGYACTRADFGKSQLRGRAHRYGRCQTTYPPAEITITFDDRAVRQRCAAHSERDGAAVAAPLFRCASAIGDGEGGTRERRGMVYWQHCGALVVLVGVAGTAIGLDVVDDGEVDDGKRLLGGIGTYAGSGME